MTLAFANEVLLHFFSFFLSRPRTRWVFVHSYPRFSHSRFLQLFQWIWLRIWWHYINRWPKANWWSAISLGRWPMILCKIFANYCVNFLVIYWRFLHFCIHLMDFSCFTWAFFLLSLPFFVNFFCYSMGTIAFLNFFLGICITLKEWPILEQNQLFPTFFQRSL